MKTAIFLLITLVVISTTIFLTPPKDKQIEGEYVIVIHGGAGGLNKNMPENEKNQYLQGLTRALEKGKKILETGGKALDAVEVVISTLEDDPLFNAGRGSTLTEEGKVEMDASIMEGKDLKCGAAASVTTVKNPIKLARLIMEKSPHVMLVAEGAEAFAAKQGLTIVSNSYFIDSSLYVQWKEGVEKLKRDKKGTVGCVALDKAGNLAAGTSTGGMYLKMHGRVGDSPIIGAGTYANNTTCAVSATGWGEKFIRNTVAFNISAMMEYKNLSLKEAADEMINKRLSKGDGGVICVDKKGNYTMVFSTESMLRGVATSKGLFQVDIW